MSASLPVAQFVVRMDDAHFRAGVFVIRYIVDENWSGLVVPPVLIAFVDIVVFQMKKQRRPALQKSPDYDKAVRVRIACSGVEVIGTVATSTFPRSAFGRAVLGPDAILFVMTDGAGLWLTSGSLVAGVRDSRSDSSSITSKKSVMVHFGGG